LLALAMHIVLYVNAQANPTAGLIYIMGVHLPGLLIEFLVACWLSVSANGNRYHSFMPCCC